jgi:glycosyltransferase involved in cell wall biosynthesis
MKIAFAIPWFLPNKGGAELGAWELARRLVARGHQVRVVTPRFRLDWPASETIDGIEVRRYVSLAPSRFTRLSEIMHCGQAVPGVLHHLNDFQPDLVHLHYLFFTGYAAMAWSRWNRRPAIITLVGNDVYDPYYVPCSFMAPVNRWMVRRADKVAAASSFIRDVIAEKFGRPRDQVDLVPYGVDLTRFHPVDIGTIAALRRQLSLPEHRPIVLTVQRLHERKGVNYYLEAARRMLAVRPNLFFVVVGSGPERDTLETLSKRLGLSENIRFTGKVLDGELPLYYQAADLFAFHTLHEGFGIVLLEAMACGKPVVTTRAGGTLDIVVEGDGGHLVQPRDAEALAERVLRVLADPNEARRMGERNRLRVEENFNWDRLTDRYMTLYEEATGAQARQASNLPGIQKQKIC